MGEAIVFPGVLSPWCIAVGSTLNAELQLDERGIMLQCVLSNGCTFCNYCN